MRTNLALLALAGCRIDLELVGETDDEGSSPSGPIDLPIGDPPPVGTCSSAFLRVGQRIDTEVASSASPATLQEWVLVGAVLADEAGRADADRDLLFASTCGPRCGGESEITVLTGVDPFLGEVGRVRLPLDAPGTAMSVVACDFDVDGVDEVAVADVSSFEDLLTVYWRGDLGSGAVFAEWAEDPHVAFGIDLACGDYDQDSRTDLVVATNAGFSVYRLDTEHPLFAVSEVSLSEVPTALAARAGHADVDGYSDLAYAAVGSGLLRWEGKEGQPVAVFGGVIVPELAGDVDGDGLDELLVANLLAGEGGAYLLRGRASPDTWIEAVWALSVGPAALPPRLVGLSDLDGDGHREVALSTVSEPDLAGRVDVYPGSVDGVGLEPLYSCVGEPGEELGVGMANVGDLDGDRRDELVVTRRVAGGTTVLEVLTRSGTELDE